MHSETLAKVQLKMGDNPSPKTEVGVLLGHKLSKPRLWCARFTVNSYRYK